MTESGRSWKDVLREFLVDYDACESSAVSALTFAESFALFEDAWEAFDSHQDMAWLIETLEGYGFVHKKNHVVTGRRDCWCFRAADIRHEYPADEVLQGLMAAVSTL